MIRVSPNREHAHRAPATTQPPRLLYLADLEVYPSYAGAIQMHRLLELYPADRLLLIYPGAERRKGIPAARHVSPPTVWWAGLVRLRGGRLLLLFMNCLSWLWLRLRRRPPAWLVSEAESFRPQAVVTVALAGSWVLAGQLARHLQVPLHVIVHDDLHYRAVYPGYSSGLLDRLFQSALTPAASVIVATEAMRESFARRTADASTFVASENPAVVARSFLALIGDPERLRRTAESFGQVGRELFSQAGNHAHFLHCLDCKAGSARADAVAPACGATP